MALRECGPLLTGFMPKLKKPSMSPRYMWSKMNAQLQFSYPPAAWGSFGW